MGRYRHAGRHSALGLIPYIFIKVFPFNRLRVFQLQCSLQTSIIDKANSELMKNFVDFTKLRFLPISLSLLNLRLRRDSEIGIPQFLPVRSISMPQS